MVLALSELGWETIPAPDAETAAGIMAFKTPDIIITDVRLPGMDGVELARRVKESSLRDTPVLLMSAYGEPPSHEGDGFLAKPFDIDGLTDFVSPYQDSAQK
jgi:CheY-like chemotaxis protein